MTNNPYKDLVDTLERLQPGISERVRTDPQYIATLEFVALAKAAYHIVDPDKTRFKHYGVTNDQPTA